MNGGGFQVSKRNAFCTIIDEEICLSDFNGNMMAVVKFLVATSSN